MDRLLQALACQDRKEAFRQIHPARVSRGVVEGHLGIPFQPLPGQCAFVGVEVVHHHAEPLSGIFFNHPVHECHEVGGLACFVPAVILSENSGAVSAKPARKFEPAEAAVTEWGKKSYFLNDFNVGSGWMPEIVLGGVMPKENILWTKDLRLLRQGDRRQQSRVRVAKRDCRNWQAD